MRKQGRDWVGPCLIICVNAKQSSVLPSMRGVLDTDRVRKATSEEWLGAEIIEVLSKDAKEHVEGHGRRGYADATHEDGPPESDRDSADSLSGGVPESAQPQSNTERAELETIFENQVVENRLARS